MSIVSTAAVRGILCDLRHGTLQPFQIEETLRMKGIPSLEVERLSREIRETYRKEHPCY